MPSEPLKSWRDGAIKTAIVDFVTRVANEDGPDFVPEESRIATFDNDGTLWCERPLQTQIYFIDFRLNEMARKEPSLRERQPFKAFLERDLAKLGELGRKAIFEISAAAHAGMTDEEFTIVARNWLATAHNPQRGRRFRDLVYQPQLELLDYLRAYGFRPYIVSGGGVDFMRAVSAEIYGIPEEQVIGSRQSKRVEIRDGRSVLIKEPILEDFNDREEKVVNIGLHIGRRPLLAFGNSDGDLAMMRYALTGAGPSLALLLHHDDGGREFAYDRDFALSPLDDALAKAGEYGITVVSMKSDWSSVFPV